MTGLEIPFPDTEAAVRKLIREWFPDELATEPDGTLHVAEETPAELRDALDFVRVTELTGTDDRITDYPIIDIDVFSATRKQAKSLAQRIRGKLLDYPHSTVLDERFILIERVLTSIRPQRVSWADATIRRYYSSYQLSVRR